ncbi:MAG: 6-bladed beta-propeller [Nitritalea sp.]
MKRLFLACMLAVFTACGGPEKQETEVKALRLQQADIPLLFSKIGNRLQVLEIKSDIPIGPMPEIVLADKYFYLFDQDYTQRLYQVDLKGNIRNSIAFNEDSQLAIAGITQLIVKGNTVGVVAMGSSIQWFDENLNEGNLEQLPAKAKYHLPYAKGYVSFNNRINETMPYDFFASNGKEIQHEALEVDKDIYPFVYQTHAPFTAHGEGLLFARFFDDTLYAYDSENGLRPYAAIDFGVNSSPEERLKQIQNPFDMMQLLNDKSFAYLNGELFMLEAGKCLFGATLKGRGAFALWNMSDAQATTYPVLKDDFKSDLKFYHISAAKPGKTVFGLNGESVAENASENFLASLSGDYGSSFFLFILS